MNIETKCKNFIVCPAIGVNYSAKVFHLNKDRHPSMYNELISILTTSKDLKDILDFTDIITDANKSKKYLKEYMDGFKEENKKVDILNSTTLCLPYVKSVHNKVRQKLKEYGEQIN